VSERKTAIVWFRQDLRLSDNPALAMAAQEYDAVVPLYIWDPDSEGDFRPGAASQWWLHHALESLHESLVSRGLRLVVRKGDTLDELRNVIAESEARGVYFTTRYEPSSVRAQSVVTKALTDDGIAVHQFDSTLLHNPETVRTNAGDPYRVFTPFWKKVSLSLEVPPELPVPRLGESRAPERWPGSVPLDALELLPKIDWAGGLRDRWSISEEAAQRELAGFVEMRLTDYPGARDIPAENGTSNLSPYLHFGMLSPAQVWRAVNDWVSNGATRKAADVYLSEIGWREFSYHLLHHYPHTTTEPLKKKYAAFEWDDSEEVFDRWKKGLTGYPIVDAGMRQLWATGWMHNRVRMIVASFLTKDLLIPWQDGAAWFSETLVDSDLANNTMGWQWAAGSGADAQPYFRIFNPVSQGKKHDPTGQYVRKWVPELRNLPDRYVHEPWKAKDVTLEHPETGEPYPSPIVDHGEARERALETYNRL
jgi:deoxyribodipyrimidine photo-lyase